MPGNFDSFSHSLMRSLAESPRWKNSLTGILRHEDPVGTPEEYAGLLLRAGLAADVWETTYLHVLAGPDPVLEWLRGTGLRPIHAALPPAEVAQFEAEFAAHAARRVPGHAGRHAVPVPARLRRRAQVVITGYDHVQVAIPRGGEDVARAFYGRLLGMAEQPKPAGAGGARRLLVQLRTGGAAPGRRGTRSRRPARRTRPSWSTTSARLRDALEAAGHECVDASGEIEGVQRFHTFDPFGNRLEFQHA